MQVTMTIIERLAAHMDTMHVSPHIKARVLRLNPNPKEGILIRGWHRKKTLKNLRIMVDIVGREDVLFHYGKKYGPLIWRKISRSACVQGHGKRKRFKRGHLLDNLLTEKQIN